MDLETMLRHATEFNFQVTAFHHVSNLGSIFVLMVILLMHRPWMLGVYPR